MSELSREFDEIFAKLRVFSIVGTPLVKLSQMKSFRFHGEWISKHWAIAPMEHAQQVYISIVIMNLSLDVTGDNDGLRSHQENIFVLFLLTRQ
jgi:hypothetical protein